jgi:hypothetical protein
MTVRSGTGARQTDHTKWCVAQLRALAGGIASGELIIVGAEIDRQVAPVPSLAVNEKVARWKRTGISTYTIKVAEKRLGPSA